MSGSIYNEFDGKQYSDQSTGERLESSIRELNEWKARAEAAERAGVLLSEDNARLTATLAAVRERCENTTTLDFGVSRIRFAESLLALLDGEGERYPEAKSIERKPGPLHG